MGKWVLIFGGLFTAIFGLSFIFAPHMFFELYTGGGLTTPSAAIDVRSTYGGFSFGIGLFLLYCSKHNIRMGLTASMLALIGIIPARLIGYGLDGAPTQYMNIFLGLEVLLLALSIIAY
ncbi:MAG: DUF4345 family protein [Robiginitomaculum sp.]|nr:DUF4345 family protein [Robiginitomaculum sp.]